MPDCSICMQTDIDEDDLTEFAPDCKACARCDPALGPWVQVRKGYLDGLEARIVDLETRVDALEG